MRLKLALKESNDYNYELQNQMYQFEDIIIQLESRIDTMKKVLEDKVGRDDIPKLTSDKVTKDEIA